MFKNQQDGKTTYESEVKLGTKYRDKQTGIEGIAVVIEFHQHMCERVVLELVDGTDVKSYIFDAARLVSLEPEKPVRTPVPTGGGTTSPVRNRR